MHWAWSDIERRAILGAIRRANDAGFVYDVSAESPVRDDDHLLARLRELRRAP